MITAADGARLHVVAEGREDQPVVVLSHALGGTHEHWNAIATALNNRYRVIRYDSRGHGRSSTPAGPYSNAMLGQDALAVLDELAIASCAFIGLSMGAMTGMWLGAHASMRISALILANTTPFIPNKTIWDENIVRAEREGLSGIASSTMDRWLGQSFKASNPEATAALVRTMAAMPVAGYAGSCAVLRDVDLRAALPTIAAPTLVIAGEEDLPQAADGARTMAASIPRGTCIFIPRAGHLSPLENPSAFMAVTRAFLEKTLA